MPLKKTIRDIEVAEKRVFVRCDFNVPQDENGAIVDDRRIRESLPTIKSLISSRAKVILASHLGRPKGKDPKWTLKPVAERLSQLLNQKVEFAHDCIGDEAESLANSLQPGSVLLLENVRCYAEETANDPAFAGSLAKLAEVYVNDAFGSAHRAHASTEGIARILPGVAGLLLERELEFLSSALENPARPAFAVLGGAKVSDKLGVIENLLPKVDQFLIGGGMVFTFLKAKGMEIGKSLLSEEHLEFCAQMLARHPEKFDLATDFTIAASIESGDDSSIVGDSEIPPDQIGCDIGPESRVRFSQKITQAGTVVWNGPMGVFEVEEFSAGTRAVVLAMEESRGITIIGGGDTAAAFERFGDPAKVSHVSTGGGASLELLEGKALPGVAVLQDE